jgi:formylglycine-generating enzyme required for sulfatase activity
LSVHRLPIVALAAVTATQAFAAERPGRVVRVEQPPSREVYVPAGVFTMGIGSADVAELVDDCLEAYGEEESNLGSASQVVSFLCQQRYAEDLQHMVARRVFVSGFRMDRDEVSTADYRDCVAAGACDGDALTGGDDRYLTADGPMVNVRWDEAQTYCRWHGGRLPSEAEWERAARGDGDGPWPWGTTPRTADFNHGKPYERVMRKLSALGGQLDEILELIGQADDSDGVELMSPPGHYAWGDGPYGTRDMAGNVAEWTADAYLRPVGSNSGYDGLGDVDPVRTGAASDERVVRGGSWRQPEFLGRVYARDPFETFQMYMPENRLPYVGFRCVLPVPRERR